MWKKNVFVMLMLNCFNPFFTTSIYIILLICVCLRLKKFNYHRFTNLHGNLLTTHQFSNHDICKILSGPQHHQKYVISGNHIQRVGLLLQIQAGRYSKKCLLLFVSLFVIVTFFFCSSCIDTFSMNSPIDVFVSKTTN